MGRKLTENLDRDVEIYHEIKRQRRTYAEIGQMYGISKARVGQVWIKVNSMLASNQLHLGEHDD